MEETIDMDYWKVEKITFDAGYNNERMQAWLYLPKDAKPPYQTVIYVPGSGTLGSGGQRIDKQKNLFLNFTKSFMINKKWLNTLQFNMYVGYTNNESNSIWYNYTNRLFGGAIQWRF